MITKFKVERFKSIESAELELGQINLFIGANGSGKSNLLESVGVLSAAAFGRIDEESLTRRGCRPGGFYKPMFSSESGGETALQAFENSHSYCTELVSPAAGRAKTWEYKREILKEGGRRLVNRHPEEDRKGDPETGLAALRLADMTPRSHVARFLNTLRSYSMYSPDSHVMRGMVADPQTREPIGLSGGRLPEAVGEILDHPPIGSELKKAFRTSLEYYNDLFVFNRNGKKEASGAAQSLGIVDRNFRKPPHGGVYVLGANQVNEGTLYFLFLAVLCLHPSAPTLFAIENADHGLNPLLVKRLMTTMSTWLLDQDEKQVLMTTQNPLVLDGLPLQDDRVRLFTVDRDSRGATVVRRFVLTEKHRKMAEDKDWPLSRMWVNGLIGGVPNV
jgi:predicted ATPase